jgi:5-methyltetrahydrofolate--homocysteine methyltransferase
MSPDVSDPAARDLTYDELLIAYQEQMDALMEG